MILTIDLGTTRTKAVVWGDAGPVAQGYATLTTRHPGPGRAEQDPDAWWTSVVDACAAARAAQPTAYAAVDAVGFAAARETIVAATATGAPLGPAIVWSDRRASEEARALGDAGITRTRVGVVVDGGAVVAKLAWLRSHEPERLAAARWVLRPRDLIALRLTGVAVSDVTLASATGIYGPDGDMDAAVVDHLGSEVTALLPPAVASASVVGTVRRDAADTLGLRSGVEVVIGAGDRQCEVLATAASPRWPMVSWGTTANVSMPLAARPDPIPDGLAVTRAAGDGWLLEGGLAAAGSLLAWLGGVTGVGVDELAERAAATPPGARGVLALPWLGGARAPWWREDVGAGFVSLGPSHGVDDLARAAMEAVAWDVVRCIEAAGTLPAGLALAGGASLSPWVTVLTAAAGVPGARREHPDAASVGAALLTLAATGRARDVDEINPVVGTVTPPAELVARYRALRPAADAAVAAALGAARA